MSSEKGVWSIIKTPEQELELMMDQKLELMSRKDFELLYCCDFHLELSKCERCGKPSNTKCNKTPAGGWGSIKCGRTLCSECECDCQEPTL